MFFESRDSAIDGTGPFTPVPFSKHSVVARMTYKRELTDDEPLDPEKGGLREAPAPIAGWYCSSRRRSISSADNALSIVLDVREDSAVVGRNLLCLMGASNNVYSAGSSAAATFAPSLSIVPSVVGGVLMAGMREQAT